MTGAHEKSVQRLAERKGFRTRQGGQGPTALLHRRSCVGWKDGVRRSRPRILVLTSRSRTVARVARRKAQGHVIADGPILLSAADQGRRSSRHRRLRRRRPIHGCLRRRTLGRAYLRGQHDDRPREHVGEQGRSDKAAELGHHAQVRRAKPFKPMTNSVAYLTKITAGVVAMVKRLLPSLTGLGSGCAGVLVANGKTA